MAEAVERDRRRVAQGHGQGHGRGDGAGRRPRRRQARLARKVRESAPDAPPARARQRGRRRAGRLRGRGPARARGPPRLRACSCAATSSRSTATRRRCGPASRSCASWPTSSAQGHEIAPGTIDAVTSALDQHESPARDPRGRRLAPPQPARSRPRRVNQKRYVDSIRHNTITFGIGPAGTGKTFLAVAMAAPALSKPRGQPHHPHPPRGRGRRAPGLPARRPDGQGRPLPAPAVRRPARHARPRARGPAPRARRDRGRAAGLHARAHAERLLRHPRRGPEHHPRADEDVPHAPRLRLEDGGHGRRHPDRPAAASSSRA